MCFWTWASLGSGWVCCASIVSMLDAMHVLHCNLGCYSCGVLPATTNRMVDYSLDLSTCISYRIRWIKDRSLSCMAVAKAFTHSAALQQSRQMCTRFKRTVTSTTNVSERHHTSLACRQGWRTFQCQNCWCLQEVILWHGHAGTILPFRRQDCTRLTWWTNWFNFWGGVLFCVG